MAETKRDDMINLFLDFLETDIQNAKPIDADLLAYVQSLFVDEDIDINAPIEDED